MTADGARLKDWILANMTSDALNELDLNKEQVARFVSLTSTGSVVLKVNRDSVDLIGEVLLHLIGRSYAFSAGLVESDSLTSDQIRAVVRGSPGGQRWALSTLKSEHMIESTGRGTYRISPSRISAALSRISKAQDSS
jgi:hypothetical protein